MLRHAGFALGALVLFTACGKKKIEVPPPLGWASQAAKGELWRGQCYFPKNFDELGPGDRRVARSAALDAMMSQWQGERDDGLKFPQSMVYELETVLLGVPKNIEAVVVENLRYCKVFMSSEGASDSAWRSYVSGLSAKLTEGDCPTRPLDYTLFDYLDIGLEWQIPAGVCLGDVVRIKASVIDEYTIVEKGPVITVEGDRSKSTAGTELPCNIEGCYEGMLLLRFRGESGVQQIMPLGAEKIFTPPEHGTIDLMINDSTWYDNLYEMKSGITDHVSIEYSPAKE